jgi:hypothetical protein
MFSLLYPEAMFLVRDLAIGLIPIWLRDDPIPKIIVKASKETILAAKMCQGFSIYLIPYAVDEIQSHGFIAAFFDNEDEPLTAGGAIMKELGAEEFRKAFLSEVIDVHFFDELNREMLGYRARTTISKEYREILTEERFPSLEGLNQGAVVDRLVHWFGLRNSEDDAKAIVVKFENSLIPENIAYIDATLESNAFHGGSGVTSTHLERQEPGKFQEIDIIHLLQRTFAPQHIFWAPLRVRDREEIADIIVSTEKSILIIQAKDSPNIERILKASIDRKRKKAVSSIENAIKQARGAIGYLRKQSPMPAIINGDEIILQWEEKDIYSLLIVKELFDDDYDVYTPPMLKLAHDTGIPCIALSYSGLHQYTNHLRGDDAFFGAYMRVFMQGYETGVFPRLRLRHPNDSDD